MMACQEFKLQVLTREHSGFTEITAEVNRILREKRWTQGLVHLFVMHTTCGLTINENADPDVLKDLNGRLEESFPWSRGADLHGEGNSAAHLKSSLFGPSLSIPVHQNGLVLGRWQGVYLCEFDGPRTRQVYLTFLN
ncbi:MAG: secondary thiamine-phosphate synthase enzyme YjbQ [bacterium]|nr:secondary thiamine-phosphate synthase enzyme YjbQ [bacterium]